MGRCPHPSAFAREAASRPAARVRQWRGLAEPACGSRAVSRAGRQCPVVAHRLLVAPEYITRCWLTGRHRQFFQPRQSSEPDAGSQTVG